MMAALSAAIEAAVRKMPIADEGYIGMSENDEGDYTYESTELFLQNTWLGGEWMDTFLRRAADAAAQAALDHLKAEEGGECKTPST